MEKIVRAILITWREACVKWKAVTKHFTTTPTYEDMITGVKGLIMYMILNTTKFPQQAIVPWYFSSDSCEQTYAFLRTGRHRGWRTNLSATDVMAGAARINRSLGQRWFTCNETFSRSYEGENADPEAIRNQNVLCRITRVDISKIQ
jgi:hypothetical protein